MSSQDANDFYLAVGRNRRSTGEFTKPYKGLRPRKVQGRKGIGKLAGFGIAGRIDVRAVIAKRVSHFALDFDDITENQSFVADQAYAPVVRDLQPQTKMRLKAAMPGQTWRKLPISLRPDCHQGKYIGFTNVYGRMRWNEVSPTGLP